MNHEAHSLAAIYVLMTGLVFSFFLHGCSETPSESTEVFKAVHIDDTDECHLCGMVINQFPGPKGQLFEKNRQSVRNFCSTNDLFAYLLQPENKHQIARALVHDMTASAWNDTRETALIDVKDAWYVGGHKLPGAMGPTLASFKEKAAAQAFIEQQGGNLLAFKDITLTSLAELNKLRMTMPALESPAAKDSKTDSPSNQAMHDH